ncbi:Fic family protein [Actinomyces wuliandei]|uniref:Fic family protein n=1 Tax=Actinomyces wuliandei TaxID=2057743 RepID=UPI001FAA54DC|nr:Fic family protein [Actinomyces wuliandei]
MGYHVTRFWESTYESGLRPRDRRSGAYLAYVPAPLAGSSLALSHETAELAARAETRVRSLATSQDLAAVGRFLLRSEAIASSQIEGIAPSAHKIALAELGQQEEVRGLSRQARTVAHNVTLVREAVENLMAPQPVTPDHLLDLHRSLLPDSPQHHGLRTVQNWVGGSSYHPLDADFVPPPPDLVPTLVEDLLTYLNEAAHAPLVQAALVHAQFETIHPFTDGNGRVGRALIHTVLARRSLLAGTVLPTSLVMSTLSEKYVEALSLFRESTEPPLGETPASAKDVVGSTQLTGGHHEPRSPQTPAPGTTHAQGGPGSGSEAWILFFLRAVILACDQAEQISAELADIRCGWEESLREWAARENAGRALRAGSAALRILEGLPGTPVLTVATVSRLYGVSRTAASRGLETLQAAGILRTESIGSGRRAYTAPAVLDAITWAERRLASTQFDTRVRTPGRAVPARPQR